MRLFLTLFLAAISYRCFAILLPIRGWTPITRFAATPCAWQPSTN